jgi:hypothetical protein
MGPQFVSGEVGEHNYNNLIVYDTYVTIFRWGYKSTNLTRGAIISCTFHGEIHIQFGHGHVSNV